MNFTESFQEGAGKGPFGKSFSISGGGEERKGSTAFPGGGNKNLREPSGIIEKSDVLGLGRFTLQRRRKRIHTASGRKFPPQLGGGGGVV